MFPVLLKSWTCQPLSQIVWNILSTCTFDKIYMTIANQVTEIVYLDIDMSRSITIGRIFAHHITWHVILPYFCGLLLRSRSVTTILGFIPFIFTNSRPHIDTAIVITLMVSINSKMGVSNLTGYGDPWTHLVVLHKWQNLNNVFRPCRMPSCMFTSKRLFTHCSKAWHTSSCSFSCSFQEPCRTSAARSVQDTPASPTPVTKARDPVRIPTCQVWSFLAPSSRLF